MSENKQSTLFTGYDYPGKRVILHIQTTDEAFASKSATEVLPALDQAVGELAKVLDPPREQLEQPVHLYLIDPASLASAQPFSSATHETDVFELLKDSEAYAAVHIVRRDMHNDQLLLTLTRTLVKHWFGEKALALSFFLDGLAGVVAASCGLGLPLKEITETLEHEIKAGKQVSIFAPSPADSASEEQERTIVHNDIATSFVAYLLSVYGQKSLQQFLSASDGERQDQAALTIYHQPLGQLEEAWLKSLQSTGKQKNPFVLFAQRLWPLLKPYSGKNVKILLCSLVGLAFNVVLPLSTRYLFDTVIPGKDASILLLFFGAMLLFIIFNTLIGVYRAQLTAFVVQHVIVDMQQKSFNHLQRLTHRFYGQAKIGDLMARLSSDVQLVQQALAQVMGNGLMMVFTTITSLIVLLSLQPLIGLLVIIIIPLVMVSYNLLGKRFQQASSDKQRLVGETATSAQENLSAHAVVKAFALEESMMTSYRARLFALLKASVRLEVIAAFFQNTLMFASLAEQLLVLGVGGYLVIRGQITVGTLIAAWSIMPSLLAPVSMFGILVETVQTASGSLERIVELQDEPVTIQDKPEAEAIAPLTSEIRFEQVKFSYESGRTIIDDLNLTIPAGTNVAIVGPSGSGKSSMISLLTRFWDVDEGRILFDGHDIRDVTLASLRDQIGLVFQDTFIFDTTVRENIAIGRQGATDSEIIAAANGAKLDEYIASLPAGYNTMLGERGVRMSGGQRQRLAIARALLRNPRILILDEATSALDMQTEREILETLDELKRGRTTISITHRLSMAATADRILVLSQGKLIEQGTHDELLQQNGLYHNLYQEQVNARTLLPEQDVPAIPGVDIARLAAIPGVDIARLAAIPGVDIARLAAIPLFKEMSTDLLARVAGQLVRQRYAMGDYIINQGEPGDAFYLLHFGQVEVLLNSHSTTRRINILDEGEFFGEMSLLSEEPRTASVRAVFPTECYVLTKSSFTLLLEQEPRIRELVLDTMQQRRSELSTIQTFLLQTDTLTNLLTVPPTALRPEQVAQAYELAAQR
jgi:ATP-binding cassette, subfamily B, bacterial